MNHQQFKQGTGTLNDMAHQCLEDSERWFGDMLAASDIIHHTLAMCGEVGEFANIVKKIDRGSLDLHDASTKVRLAEELADVLTYMLNIAGLLHIDLEKAYLSVRANNEHRFMIERHKREEKKNG